MGTVQPLQLVTKIAATGTSFSPPPQKKKRKKHNLRTACVKGMRHLALDCIEHGCFQVCKVADCIKVACAFESRPGSGVGVSYLESVTTVPVSHRVYLERSVA